MRVPITIFLTTPIIPWCMESTQIDHGTKFSLAAMMQQYLAMHCVDQQRVAVLRTTSRQNRRAERLWPEIDS